MQILTNLLSDNDIDVIHKFWDEQKGNAYINEPKVDKRLIATEKNCPHIYNFVDKHVKSLDPTGHDYYIAYQQQHFAHWVHTDDYKYEHPYVYTIVYALDTIPEFKTLVWKEQFDNNDHMHKAIYAWGENKGERKSNISETEDLDHMWDENNQAYWVDYLTPEGVFAYNKGDAVAFHARKAHCTSYWLKYPQHTMRELLQVHWISEQDLGL